MAMTSIYNWRRFGVPCLLCCALLAASGCSDRRSEQFRAEGDTLRELKRIEAARDAYERAAQANPSNPMAQLGLARCSALEGDIDGALSYFRAAIALDPGLDDAYAEAVRMLAGADRMAEALSVSDDFAEQSPEIGGGLRGVLLLRMGRTEDAINLLTDLTERYPNSEAIQLDLGAALLKGGRAAEAETYFKELAGGSGTVAVAARMGLIDVYRAQGRAEELIGEFQALAEARPDDRDLQLAYARSLLIAQRGDEAEEIARRVLEESPESGWANFIVGYQKVQSRDFEEARAFLEQAARALPDDVEVKNLLAFAASGGTAVPEEERAAQPFPARPATAPAAPSTWEGLWKQAALNRLLENRAQYLAEGGTEARETLSLAALFTFQAELAKEIAGELPDTSPVRGFLDAFFSRDAAVVAAHFEGWKAEETREVLLRDNALGFAMVAGGSREQGISAFLFCLDRQPDHGVALFNIAQVFRQLRRPMIAAQSLQRLIAMYPENIDAHQAHYTALREGGSFDAARRAAEASYTLFPDERWSHLYLCQAYLDAGEPQLALQWLGRAISQFPSDPELQSIMGRVLVRMGDCDRANTVLEEISTTAPAIMSARATLLSICRVIGEDWPGATEIAVGIAPENRSDSLTLVLAAGLFRAGDSEAARAALGPQGEGKMTAGRFGMILAAALGADSLTISEEEQGWAATLAADTDLLANYVAVVAFQAADLNDVAWNYYQKHLAGRPPHIALAQLAYRCLGNGDRIEDPAAQARAIADSLPDDARAWLGLASVMKSLDDAEGEAAAVAKALQVGPKVPEALFRHASMMEASGNIEGAVADYRTLVEVAPDSGAANNNLAYTLLLAGGRDEEALTYAAVAAEKLPRDPSVLHTLGLAQFRTGDLDKSRVNLRRAIELDPSNPTIMYDYARLLAASDEKDEAVKRISYALAMNKNAGLDFPQAAEAEAMLESLAP